MPPDRTTYEYYIIVIPVFHLIFDCGTGIGISFFECDLGTGRVGGWIRIDRLDFEQITMGQLGNIICYRLSVATPTEMK